MNHPTLKHFLFLAALCSFTLATQLGAQNTAFTYQGRLNENGAAANGVYDFTFQAFDAPSAGNSIGGTANVNAVGVTNGLFTALVDLGGSPFTGPARWLQISVSTNGAGSFTTLVPRQALTPSPFAIFAHTAGTVTNGAITSAQLAANSVATANIQNSAVTTGKIASGQVVKSLNGLTDAVSLTSGANVTINPVGNSLQISAPAGGLNLPFSGAASSSGSIFTLSNSAAGAAAAFLGRVGIGTASPATPLHVRGTSEGLRIDGHTNGGLNQAFISFRHLNGTSSGYVGDGSSEDHIYLAADRGDVALLTSGGRVLTAKPNGRVGIGTATPQAMLEVQGDIRLGPTGEFRATSGEENLRIVRGSVDANGAPIRGSGFTSSRPADGDYLITFTQPFAGTPTVTANLEYVGAFRTRVVTPDVVAAGSANIVIREYQNDAPFSANAEFHFIAIGPR
jgi:hypothetical protein